MSKKNQKPTQQTKSVRAIALVLAFLMIAGAATVVFSLIAGILHSGEDHTGHDHAEVQYVQSI